MRAKGRRKRYESLRSIVSRELSPTREQRQRYFRFQQFPCPGAQICTSAPTTNSPTRAPVLQRGDQLLEFSESSVVSWASLDQSLTPTRIKRKETPVEVERAGQTTSTTHLRALIDNL